MGFGPAQGNLITNPDRGYRSPQPPDYEAKVIALIKAAASSQGYWYRNHSIGSNTSVDDEVFTTWVNVGPGTGTLTQGTTARKPLVKLDILNASRIARFDGSDDSMTNSTPNWVSSGIGSVALVYRYNSVVANKVILNELSGGSTVFVKTDAGSVLEMGSSTARDFSTAPDTNWHILIFSFNGASGGTALRDGVAETVAAGSLGVSTAVGGFILGAATGAGGAASAMDVAELILTRGTVWSATGMANISAYLNRKFRIY